MNVDAKKPRMLVLCDFDGTVSTVDMGSEILNRFTDTGWEEIDRAYCSGEIGSRAAYTQVAPLFTGSRAQILEFVSSREMIDPHFLEFYRFCQKNAVDLKIVSDGLDFYIDAILKKNNLQDIEFFSNVTVFHDGNKLSIEFPRMNNKCEKCGTCKKEVLREHRSDYDRVIYVGNGYSDVCPAKDADLVFAKDVLYDTCGQDGTACVRYKTFQDILAYFNKAFCLNC
ncbi:MAG TPA: MtnX-like HAD-IB family phosphatase [Syntrophales bacterium]|nr:MtnX-like HAD-IB family phosphatase [Syntrophales bacterium]